jgi:hypothetical protein
MSTLCINIPNHFLNDYLPVKNGKQLSFKLWMLTLKPVSVREFGEPYLKQLSSAEYEFCGKVLAEMSINDVLVLIVDCGNVQFYVENGPSTDSHRTGSYLNKFVRGQGTLTVGEYPYNMGVADTQATISKITRVTIPQSYIDGLKGRANSIPMYLPPTEYSESDMRQFDELTRSDEHAGYLFFLLEADISA